MSVRAGVNTHATTPRRPEEELGEEEGEDADRCNAEITRGRMMLHALTRTPLVDVSLESEAAPRSAKADRAFIIALEG